MLLPYNLPTQEEQNRIIIERQRFHTKQRKTSLGHSRHRRRK